LKLIKNYNYKYKIYLNRYIKYLFKMSKNEYQKVIFDKFGKDCGEIIFQYKLDLENAKYKYITDYINSGEIRYKEMKELVNIKEFHNYCIENKHKFGSLIHINYSVENWFGKNKNVAYNKRYNNSNIKIINGPFSIFDNYYHNKFNIKSIDSRSNHYGYFSNHYIIINVCYKESLFEKLKEKFIKNI